MRLKFLFNESTVIYSWIIFFIGLCDGKMQYFMYVYKFIDEGKRRIYLLLGVLFVLRFIKRQNRWLVWYIWVRDCVTFWVEITFFAVRGVMYILMYVNLLLKMNLNLSAFYSVFEVTILWTECDNLKKRNLCLFKKCVACCTATLDKISVK